MECDSQTFCLPKLSVGEGGGLISFSGMGRTKNKHRSNNRLVGLVYRSGFYGLNILIKLEVETRNPAGSTLN